LHPKTDAKEGRSFPIVRFNSLIVCVKSVD
jgi:hypothetical protein